MRVPCVTLRTGGAQPRLGVKLPAHSQLHQDPRRGIWASPIAEMHLRHLPGPGRCGRGHDAHLHALEQLEAEQKPLGHLKSWQTSAFGRMSCSPGVSTKVSLLEIS